ncbi:uncharacterized protein A4U43_C07F36270 [Asparagus officinalis]|uniref:Nuclear transcription factor Y subunit n=1 Tax=Asparagus officinalis TaxID=4686 RepID=A0A5P1EHI6_ASPOF|nr:nuclear transcription factor Y subunit A-7-like [Asparagus officinalis]XP_020274218.1 nuclear transcription factor Y subunit A-7-like [Asparagus officinalis]ONK65356.1 uncharacterized protein A4U43_C07F36270 [Asparagus officinalis]
MSLEHVEGFEMRNIGNKDSKESSAYSTPNCVNLPSWWNSSASNYPPSYPKNLYMNMDPLAPQENQLKYLGAHIADQDSSSTHSSDQSHQELSGSTESKSQGQCISAQSGNEDAFERHLEGHLKSASSSGAPEVALPSAKLDYNPSIACIPYPYTDPYYGGVLAPYGSHAIIHPQLLGMAPSSRVPLPHEQAEEEPIYVNAKQFHAILRRRELRAKQEAQNKLIKGRKPYLHESRHMHAMKRARGVGGRFLNTKKLQQRTEPSENRTNAAGLAGSDVSSISNGNGNDNGGFHHHQNHFDFKSHIMGNGQNSGQHRVSVMR